MIKPLIRITSQDQMFSRESEECLRILMGCGNSGRMFGQAAASSRAAQYRRVWCRKSSHRDPDHWAQGCHGIL